MRAINTELERSGGDGGLELLLILHHGLGRLTVGGGEIAVMYQKTVGLIPLLAVAAQSGRDRLTFLAGIDEYKALLAPCMLKNIAHARVGVPRRFVGGDIKLGQRLALVLLLISAVAVNIKMLH